MIIIGVKLAVRCVPLHVSTDYVGYIKKAMLLLRQFRQMKRVQLSLLLDPEPEPEVEEPIPEELPIGQ